MSAEQVAPADRQTRLSVLLADPRGQRVLRRAVPKLFEAPEIPESVRDMVVGTLLDYARLPEPDLAEVLRELAEIPVERRPEPSPIDPDPDYESPAVERGSARSSTAAEGVVFGTHEIVLDGPAHGNPFVDVDLWADLRLGAETVRVGGFYDGDGRYVIRFLPPAAGTWRFRTGSTARSLDGIDGEITIAPSDLPGPVRAVGHHFTHADGTPYLPIGTTVYSWTHQEPERERETLATLAEGPFTKVRMCVFPKHYDLNHDEPPRHPFVRAADGRWDTTRFDVGFFRHLESRIRDLATLGIQADVILFHPYDRWGYQDLGVAADDRYVRYLVRRLAGFANVWWSLANEYDLMAAKREPDWARIGRLVAASDHAGHLLSIHNGTRLFDFAADWITHASIQATDSASPAPNIGEWRARWGKPVVVDELGYEGDIEFGWGSLSGRELVRRCWQIALRGAYTTHGETYLNPDRRLWWATGGTLVGESPERIALLARLLAECPGPPEPVPTYTHVAAAGLAGRYELHYFDHFQPRSFTFRWPEGRPVVVEVVDTLGMTVERLDGEFSGTFTVDLPGRPELAVRLRAAA